MIMLAKVVPYGGNAVRYALEKEKAKVVKVNHMPEGIDLTAIWYIQVGNAAPSDGTFHVQTKIS